MRILIFTLLIASMLGIPAVNGQGCSDAGFCTMGAMRPDQAYSKRIAVKLRSMEVNFYRGTSLLTPIIYVSTLDATIGLNDKNYIQVKLPYQYAKGTLGEVSGMGDISLSFTRTVAAKKDWALNATFGGKIAMGDGNETVNNESTGGEDAPAHMYYQPSLGSNDIVGGLSWINGKWLFATGIQIPLTKNNNQFAWSGFDEHSSFEYVLKYNRGPELLRGTDFMLRAERNWRFTNWNFSLGLLPIWRITKDNGINPDTGEREDYDGTTGMAMSALASFGYQFDVNSSIRFIHGHKLTDREFNPDGLTRKTVNSISYIYKF